MRWKQKGQIQSLAWKSTRQKGLRSERHDLQRKGPYGRTVSAGAACSGVTIAVNGTTHFVASAFELGHTFQGMRTPCNASRSAKSAIALTNRDHTPSSPYALPPPALSLSLSFSLSVRDLTVVQLLVNRERTRLSAAFRARDKVHCSAHAGYERRR